MSNLALAEAIEAAASRRPVTTFCSAMARLLLACCRRALSASTAAWACCTRWFSSTGSKAASSACWSFCPATCLGTASLTSWGSETISPLALHLMSTSRLLSTEPVASIVNSMSPRLTLAVLAGSSAAAFPLPSPRQVSHTPAATTASTTSAMTFLMAKFSGEALNTLPGARGLYAIRYAQPGGWTRLTRPVSLPQVLPHRT
jgi:hypothetical protein